MKTRALAFILAAGTAMALSAGAQAMDRSDNSIFCGAIGLSQENQVTCVQQLAKATSAYDRKSVQITWVARSALVVGASRDYTPPLGNSPIDGKPATIQRSIGYVPNRVVADITRAMNSVLRDPALTEFAAAEGQTRRR